MDEGAQETDKFLFRGRERREIIELLNCSSMYSLQFDC
jgi:hypothetical protein